MYFLKKEKFTFLDWAIHFGITMNIIVILYIVGYVMFYK